MHNETYRQQSMQVPLHVLGEVHPRAGIGWEWSCNYKGCVEHGYRVGREAGYDAVANHWRERHRSTGGSRK